MIIASLLRLLFYSVFCIGHLDLLWTQMMFAFGKVPLELETFHLWLNGGFLAHQHSAVYKSYFNVQRGPRIRRVLGLEKLRNKDICDSFKFDKSSCLMFWESKFKFRESNKSSSLTLYIERVGFAQNSLKRKLLN